MKDFKYIYYLTKVDGLGSVRIKSLLDKFGKAQNVFESSIDEIVRTDGVSHKTAGAILQSREHFSDFDKEYSEIEEQLKKIDAGVITILDENYPELLKRIYDPPVILYYKCRSLDNDLFFKNTIAVVGTRKPSDYGKHVAEKLAAELSSMGMTIVSGFARGVDSIAHNAVISNKNIGGRTIAVLGSGVDVVYPPENKKLYEKISEEGLIMSECEISAKPDAINFPRRNRIISGLSLGVVVIESGSDGGALITARCALDQSREVFAVPGYITSKYSNGTNELIKNGHAKLVQNVDDILVEIENKLSGISREKETRHTPEPEIRAKELKGNEKLIFDVLVSGQGSVHIDVISESSGLNISDCLVNLLNLEFKSYVKQLPGKMFSPT